ncbi:MAG TPA: discoidin domain-containing protein, partial [Bacilli bacterium]
NDEGGGGGTGAGELSVSSVTASSDDGNVPSNTLDKDLTTRWSAKGDGQWIKFDLGTSVTVGSIKIAWYQGDQRTSDFDVEVSADGTNWTQIYSGSSSGYTTQLETYDFSDTTARYVRIVGHGNSSSDWNSITEVEIYGGDGTSEEGGSKLTVSAASASTYDTRCDCDAPNAIDGDFFTRWSGEGDGAWILFDLGTNHTVNSVRIAFYNGDQRTSSFDIETSADGTNWTQVYSGSSIGTTTQPESFDVSDTTARYVRYVGHGNTSNDWNSLTEVEIYGS